MKSQFKCRSVLWERKDSSEDWLYNNTEDIKEFQPRSRANVTSGRNSVNFKVVHILLGIINLFIKRTFHGLRRRRRLVVPQWDYRSVFDPSSNSLTQFSVQLCCCKTKVANLINSGLFYVPSSFLHVFVAVLREQFKDCSGHQWRRTVTASSA